MLFLPESASHFLQPLDSYPFGGLKRQLASICEQTELGISLTGDRPINSLLRAAHAAEERSMAERAIEGGFRACGICPCDRDIAKKLLNENLGIAEKLTAPDRVRP